MVAKKDTQKQRASHLRWIPIAEMRVSPKAQRKFRKAKAEKYAADFDLEAIGFPVVSMREGNYWIVDGQHRIEALKLMGWGDQMIQCECYEGLEEEDEAELFLRRDERTAIPLFEKFRIAVHAGRPEETEIQRTVMGVGLKISQDGSDKSIGCVSALKSVYSSGGTAVLRRTLKLGQAGFAGDYDAFNAQIIKGVGRVCQRYNGSLDDEQAAERLGSLKGANELLRKAYVQQSRTGRPKDECVAAAFIDVYNSGRGGKKLDSWWK